MQKTLYLFEDEEENRFMAIITMKEFYEYCIVRSLKPIVATELGEDGSPLWPTDILFSEDMLS